MLYHGCQYSYRNSYHNC